MKGAVIDLGTNTFNLLVFKKKGDQLHVLHNERVPVGLGMGGINEKIIAPEAFERGVKTIEVYVKKAHSFGVTNIRAFGTSAMRDARNVKSFVEEVFSKTNLQIEVIDGIREAELIYKGVQSIHTFEEKSCIMDIGGGSTEFIFVENQQIVASQSFNIGVSRLLQGLDLSDPLNEQDITLVEEFLSYKTGTFFQKNSASTLIGSSGSFETFYTLMGLREPISENEITAFDFDQLMTVLDELIQSTQAQRDTWDNIIEIRKKMIHIAALKTRWVIEQFGIKQVYVSPASLKEGVMSEMIIT